MRHTCRKPARSPRAPVRPGSGKVAPGVKGQAASLSSPAATHRAARPARPSLHYASSARNFDNNRAECGVKPRHSHVPLPVGRRFQRSTSYCTTGLNFRFSRHTFSKCTKLNKTKELLCAMSLKSFYCTKHKNTIHLFLHSLLRLVVDWSNVSSLLL